MHARTVKNKAQIEILNVRLERNMKKGEEIKGNKLSFLFNRNIKHANMIEFYDLQAKEFIETETVDKLKKDIAATST